MVIFNNFGIHSNNKYGINIFATGTYCSTLSQILTNE